MGTAERKLREKETLRSLILESAKKLFIENGVEQTTIRAIAKNIDYSVGTVYFYFKDKNEILNALHTQGFSQLGLQFSVLKNVNHPMERLMAMGRLYIAFALENPDMYELMFTLKEPMEVLDSKEHEQWDEGISAFRALKDTVNACIKAGHFNGHTAEPLTYMIWSVVHGMCSLYISKRTGSIYGNEPENLVNAALEEFLMMLRKL
ncbi:AcrR family transcriptional regulator [Mucilaginibacter auburnensis]|uniref:AcrR family transcriptional regulator n=2 Tax=Mucilaginibacter auburnensis TaxID=1457233 RepID=A0A2H9VMP2_9SPHI|nr:AcrR family transcriptional regulator [Mucilaginibacter auburnensis]